MRVTTAWNEPLEKTFTIQKIGNYVSSSGECKLVSNNATPAQVTDFGDGVKTTVTLCRDACVGLSGC